VFSVYWKSRDHWSTLYDSPMPYAMFFSGGQAVHFSADFAARGYAGASHGCVNVRDEAAIAGTFAQVRNGDKVVLHRRGTAGGRTQGSAASVAPATGSSSTGGGPPAGGGDGCGARAGPGERGPPAPRCTSRGYGGSPGSVRRPITSRLTHYCVAAPENVTPRR